MKKKPAKAAPPTPAQVIAARVAADQTQTEAAAVLPSALSTWQGWEAEEGSKSARAMHPALFEFYCLLTQYPEVAAAREKLKRRMQK